MTYLRLSEIVSSPLKKGLLPVSKPTIWRWIKAGKFPKPLSLGAGVRAWKKADIEIWLQNKEQDLAS